MGFRVSTAWPIQAATENRTGPEVHALSGLILFFPDPVCLKEILEREFFMEKIFKLKENGTTVRTEIVAGLTTFMTMAYIIALNPNILTNYGAGGQDLWNGVFLATCIASAIAMFCMAFLANKPFCLAPGMGLNAFFAVVVANIMSITSMGYVQSFQAALVIILIEGIVFIALSLLNIREKIVEAIPLGVRLGIAPAIGLMLMNIGFGSNIYIAGENGQFFVMKDFFGALTAKAASDTMGTAYPTMVLSVVTLFVGLFVIVLLAKKGVKGAVLIGMLAASVIHWIGSFAFLQVNPFASLEKASWLPPFGDMAATTLFKFNFQGFVDIGAFTIVTLVITFCMIDMFDTIGTLVGTASRAGMVDKQGNMPNMKEALLADAVGTGLTALTCGVIFLACIFIAPIAAIIPAAATSAALIYVGVLMLQGLKNVKFDDLDQMVPVALMLIAMPISSSIGHAIGLGLISYTVIKVFTGKFKDVSVLTYVISALFLIKFFLIV